MEMVVMDSPEWVIKVQDNVDRMDDTSKEVEFWKKRSVYRIPACVTDINKNNKKAYKPQLVSFGPYHYGEEHLKSMEDHKERALLHFLRRSNKPLESYIKSLSNLVKDFKESYDSLDDFPELINDEAFLRLMILDGCFMLEVMRTATQTIDDYAHNDPIFSNHGKLNIVPYIKRDMLMLENQLPLSLLSNLVAIENGKCKDEEKKVIRLVLNFCSLNTRVENIMKRDGKCLHILDIFRKSLLWQDPKQQKKNEAKKKRWQERDIHGGGEEIVRSATELNEAGIQFKKSKTVSLKDISFKRGTLELPPIVVDDTTESMFLNLIAFERFHVGAGNDVTSYIFFMDNIIDNAKDVSLLHSKGIIQNAIGSDKAVAKLFNSLSKDVTLDPDSSLDQVHKKVHRYCKKSWNEWRANLIHTYFRSPWAILSVIAAIVLFALTIAQTIYTVYPYYHPREDSSSPPPSASPNS